MSTPVRRALYGALAGDVTLNALLGTPATGFSKSIYHREAPAGAAFPFVIFQKQAGTPQDAFGVPGALEHDVWLIKAVDRNTTADVAESVQARVASLLNDASLSISGATLTCLRRQSDVQYGETIDGVRYEHAGVLFRLVTS